MLTQLLYDPTRYDEHFTACVVILRKNLHDVVPMQFIYSFAAAVVMAVTYGYEIKEKETFVATMQRAVDMFLRVATPELSAMCAMLPFRGCLPFDPV